MKFSNYNFAQILLFLALSLVITALNYVVSFFIIDYFFPYQFNVSYFLGLMIILIVFESAKLSYFLKDKLAAIVSTNTFLTWLIVLFYTGTYGVFGTNPDSNFYIKNITTTMEHIWLNALLLVFSILGAMIGESIRAKMSPKSSKSSKKSRRK